MYENQATVFIIATLGDGVSHKTDAPRRKNESRELDTPEAKSGRDRPINFRSTNAIIDAGQVSAIDARCPV